MITNSKQVKRICCRNASELCPGNLLSADYEDLELADIHAVLLYAARLSQVKRMSPVIA